MKFSQFEFKYLSYIIIKIMSEIESLMQNLQKTYLEVNQNFKIIIDSDPQVFRQDSAKGLLTLICDIKNILAAMNKMSVEERAKYFNITYNAIVYISDIAALLRKSNYSFQTSKELIQCILSMEANIILQDIKYLDKRTKLYLDICHIYEQNQFLQPAIQLLNSALIKYKELKSIHELDPPLPLHVETILANNIRILKVMWIKYSVQSSAVNPNDWRKKVDEQFGDDIYLKLTCLVQCLRTETRKQSNVFQKNNHSILNKNYKQVLLQAGYDLVKPFLQTIQKSLQEQKTKIERQVTFKNTQQLTQELINEEIKKKREIEEKSTKINDFKKASTNFPFQFHGQLIHYAYEAKNNKILTHLIEVALLRSQCRRIEVPYISDVGILASTTPNPNIPNGYEKIPVDLNEANLKLELKKLRKKNEGKGLEQEKPAQQKDGKDNKKAAKDPKAPVAEQIKKPNKDAPTQAQLKLINHKFVYMIIKRSMSPQNAVYDLNIVMGDQEEGPVGFMDTRRIIVPYIQDDMDIQQSKVKQYKGIKQSTHMVPYIILKHSKNGLEDEQQKSKVVIDVKPLIGKNPIMPPSWGFQKIPIDLRQVPEQFLKSSNHDYVYVTYKTDQLFHIYERHTKILNALYELQSSQVNLKAQTAQQQKNLELGITFSLQKLNKLFLTMQECLDGKLGQDYYLQRRDFLTHLTYHIWSKFLRNVIVQFDYVNQMKLNEELADYDYQFYRQAMEKTKTSFLNGFRVLNFIMINNQNSDILLLSRINLELLKILEEQQEYKQAFENAKMCLQRIRSYRDQYLSHGLKGGFNRLLPFSLTCSNLKIKDTLEKMKNKFKEQRNFIRKQKRIRQRKEKILTQEQIKQQESQYLHFQKKDEIDNTIEKVGTSHSQLMSLVSAIELDILNIYFRTTLKYVDYLKIVERQSSNNIINGVKETNLQGLAASMKNRLSLMYTKGQQKNQQNLKELQTTLIQAQKLPPPKPGLHWLQKKLIEECQKNPYALSLLMANFAAKNSQSEDKKYFLKESLDNIKKCIEEEKQQCERAINNSIFIFSTLWDDYIRPDASSSTISPFKQLYDGTWPSLGPIPSQPILISKSSCSITMKIPPFKSNLPGKKRIIKHMSLYGKPSANGVDVSVNCNELEGTGLKNRLDEVVKISNLKNNNVYCFAVAPTNQQSQLQNIGRTCSDIRTLNPLPICMLASYLAKISYQIGQYQVSYNASKIVVDEVCEQSNYRNLDEKINNLYTYKLKEQALTNMSLLQMRSIVESLYVVGLCERRNLKQFKQNNKNVPPVLIQQKEQKITNWLMLASLLNPCLSSPITSIPFLIPDDYIVLKALSLTLIPPKWMNSKIRQLGVKVMQKVLKWGLEKNQISLARRITYKWSERKWYMLGKVIQIQEKKEVKKGAKDSKDQQVKLIDKYCRMLIQKSPGQIQMFQDSLGVISDEYSDYMNMLIERGKQQIAYYTQFVDNSPEQLDGWTNRLNSRLEMSQYLKDPFNNIKKFNETSPFYLEANSKILRKALENCSVAEYKALNTKSQQLNVASDNKQINLSRQIQSIILEAISNNIEWIPSAKNEIIKLQQKTGKNLSKEIQLYTSFEAKMSELTTNVSKMDSLVDKYKDYDYLNIWISQLYLLKSTIAILNSPNLVVKNPIKGRYDKVRLMSLEDLLKKKKQVEVLDKESITYTQDELKFLNEVLKQLCEGAYSSYCVQNWIKLQNILKLLYNLINKFLITPFYHRGNSVWQYFTFLSLISVLMLKKIRFEGFETFKNRYQKKQSRTQLKIIASKLQIDLEPMQMIEIFVPKYFMPQLDPGTTKNYWFDKYPKIDLQLISSILAYTVQTLRVEGKYNLVINLSRDFCNITQHYHSLEFLPFMIQSQQKLIDEVKQSINKQNLQLNQVVNEYTKKKSTKMKGERQHKLTNEPLPYQIQYEQKRKKLLESMQLLNNHQNYLQAQIEASQRIIEEIKRDTSKTVLKQRDQRKYLTQFGDDEEHMFKSYGDDTRLAKNRKNAIKDIIEQYEKIYKELKNNKTSKDTLAQIQNRNEVGNLYFAAGSCEKALQFWEDAIATIFKTVRPIDHYLDISREKKTFVVNSIGQKQTILSLNLLYKISKFGSFKKLYYQFNCTKMACWLANALYENDSKHPQTLLGHSNYRLSKLSERDSFQDEATINLTQLVSSLQYFSLRAIDMGNSIHSLPLLNLYQHLVIDIVKNIQYSVRVKILKAIALANCGLISQSLFYLAKIANEKDLPTIWIEPSDHYKREKGSNWFFEEVAFDNSKAWNDTTNKQAIQYLKKLILKNQFVNYGLYVICIFNYAKGLLLSKIFYQQIYDSFQNNELRIANIQQAENIMRDALKRLSILEQHFANLQELEKAKLKLNRNQINDDAEKAVQSAKSSAIAYLKSNGVEETLIVKYMSERPSNIKKVFRVEFMARIRYSIHQSYIYRRLTSNSFYVLKNCLTNIHRISYGSRKVQTGYDPEIATVPVAQQESKGKKDDKKAGKKQEENVGQVKQVINWDKEKQKQKMAEEGTTRISINIFWHLKLTFEIGRLMYQQNKFNTSKKILENLVEQCRQYQQHYYSIFAQGYILRCSLRLGRFEIGKFQQAIKLATQKQYDRQQLLELMMDLGQIIKGQRAIPLIGKGKDIAAKLWQQLGMKLRLYGINVQNTQRLFSNKDELTAEQQQEIKRKNKKVQKKGGKDDKKAAKKEDPKKKKDQSKAEYKIQPLVKYEWWNLLDEQKQNYQSYILKPHPNFHPNNIYSSLPLQYIKSYTRYLELVIENQFVPQMLSQIPYIQKLIKIIESYPVNGYYYLVHLYYCIAQINKQMWKHNFVQFLNINESKKVRSPHGDYPLNSQLMALPSYSQFVFDNRKFLQQAEAWFRKLIGILKGNCLLFDNGLQIDQVLWKAADNELCLAQYCGRTKPKFYNLQNLADAQNSNKLQHINQVGQAISQLEISIKIKCCLSQLYSNYVQLGSKPLEPNAKLDQDIIQQINQIDKQFKSSYPKIVADSLKPKQGVNALELLTYITKIHRQSQFMTYSNSYCQSVILRAHRILSTGCISYRDKCTVSNVDYLQKKSAEDKIVEAGAIYFKSKSGAEKEQFIYILGGQDKQSKPYYGRLKILALQVSMICEKLYQIRAKLAISEKKSQAVKNRDFILYQKQLKLALLQLGHKFSPSINDLPQQIKISLTNQNLNTLLKMLEQSGSSGVNKQINGYLRFLHEAKYFGK